MADCISPLKVLARKRPKLSTDWDKCVICQSQKEESLRNATDKSLETFVSAVTERKDDIFLRLQSHTLETDSLKPIWHRSCYQTYTSKTNIARGSKVSSEELESKNDTNSKAVILRSCATPSDISLCIFCQKATRNKDKTLHKIQVESVAITLLKAIEELNDDEMRLRLSGRNPVAAGVKYHLKCYRDYTYQSSKSSNETLRMLEVSDKDTFSKAFEVLTEEIDDGLFHQGKAFSVKHLLTRYINLLGEDPETSNYRADKLQNRLKSYYGDRIVVQSQIGRSKSNILFSSSISVGQAITAAAELKNSLSVMATEPQEADIDTDCNTDQNVNTLYHSAKLLRTILQSIKGSENVEDSQEVSSDSAESLVPDHLYMFLRWLLEDDTDTNPISAVKEKSLKPHIHRRILSLAQDLIFACCKGILTPKHIGLGVTVKHMTGSKELVRILNRFGHCISYDEVVKLEKGFVEQNVANYKENDVVIPSNISPGKFVQAAADNLDFNEETLDGKHTTHATTLVLYQRNEAGNFGAEVVTKLNKKRQPLSELKLSVSVMNFSKQCRKLQIPDCLLSGKDDTSNEDCPIRSAAKCLDMAWIFARLCPSKHFQISLERTEKQTVPSWSAFNALVSSNASDVSSIGYCPMIPSTPTEYSTVYTVMKTVQNMMKVLHQQYTVITFDEAIYCKAKEIQWRSPQEFKDTVLRLGGFHTALTFIAVIGKRYEESGLEDLLIEAGVYGSNSVLRIMKGKVYNKGVRAMKLLMEAFSRVRVYSLASQIKKKKECADYIDSISKLKEAVGLNDETACREILQDIENKSNLVTEELAEIRERSKNESGTFEFWDEFIEMIEILLRFIRAERDGIWTLHIDALSEMLPYFFAYDRVNYARWATVYFADMKSLCHTAKEVNDEFMNGNHPVKRAVGKFNQVWTDLALEQSVNKDSKVKGGIIGYTQQESAVSRWFLTAHTRANIVASTKAMCENSAEVTTNVSLSSHKESGKKRIERDEDDVQKILAVLTGQMLNPFNTDTHKTNLVMNLATGMTSTEDVSKDIKAAKDVGKSRLQNFVQSRLVDGHEQSVFEPISKNKLKTLGFHRTPVKVSFDTNSKLKTINADRGFFSRLIVVAKSRSVDLKSVLSHELSPVPQSLAHPDSSLRKTQKSKLLNVLEGETTASDTLTESGHKCAWIYDAMALVQKIKATVQNTFGEYASLLLDILLKTFNIHNCDRVDVVFDRYDKSVSIKTSERQRRQKSKGLYFHIHGPQTPLPRQWAKFMDDPRSKANLTMFLCDYWCEQAPSRIPEGKSLYIAGGFESGLVTKHITHNTVEDCPVLFSNQEEADTRMLLHAFHAVKDCPRIIVDSPDTDVAVLCTYFWNHLNGISEMFFYTGSTDKRRFVPIHDIARKLGPCLSDLLLPFHALTGCDSTSSVGRLGKVKPWKLLKGNSSRFQHLSALGTAVDVDSSSLRCAEQFVCEAFGSKHLTINEVRYDMFCKRFTKTEDLPPTQDSLTQHVNRANYQSLVWKRALVPIPDIPDPIGYGWEKEGETIKAKLMTKDCAPKSLLVVISCGCIKSECRGRCSCLKEGLPCIDSCSCGAGEGCKNPSKAGNFDDDDDDDDEVDGDVSEDGENENVP